MLKNIKKNNAESLDEEWILEAGFIVLKTVNNSDIPIDKYRKIHLNSIHFHFNIHGKGVFSFKQGSYKLPLTQKKALLIYNPIDSLPFNLNLNPKGVFISVFIPIKKFHSLFSEDTHYINFLNQTNKNKKYYKELPIPPSQATILHQIAGTIGQTQIKRLYIKAKIYELLSLFFDQEEDPNIKKCPFLADGENVEKIRAAKEIIISKMTNPPTLTELANMTDISLKKLKTGFKQIYGDSVFSFLLDYKLDYARNLLENEHYSVSEVSHNVGYSTPSHFIKAFKKKFGITPKQYYKTLEL